jgi:type IV pilus assembly protein PilC
MHEAFGQHPEVFTKLYTSMLRAGEESGNLANALNELAIQLEKALRLRRAVKAAAYYPIIMGCVAFVVISILLILIVPEFAKLFVQTVHETEVKNPLTGKYPHSTALPLPTQIVFKLSQVLYPNKGGPTLAPITFGSLGFWFIQFHPFSIGAIFRIFFTASFLYGAFRVAKRVLREEGPRAKWDYFKLNAPMRIGPLIQKIVVARFARTFASLLRSGVPAQEAMEIVADTAGNSVVALAVLEARTRMLAGSNIAEPLARSGVFPSMVTRMIEVGEETGQLEHMLIKVAEFFEEEVEMAVKALVSLVEPIMILVIGICIGFIIISCYLPMFDLYNLVGTGPGAPTPAHATASLLLPHGVSTAKMALALAVWRVRPRTLSLNGATSSDS